MILLRSGRRGRPGYVRCVRSYADGYVRVIFLSVFVVATGDTRSTELI